MTAPGRREPADALLLDLDGVLRVFPPAGPVEARHGLPAGSLPAAAFAWPRLLPTITGQVGHAGWLDSIVDGLVVAGVSPSGARAAVDDWSASRGEVVPEVLDFVREVRAAGLPVALVSNATDRLDADLAALGLTGEFDAVVNSSVVGFHKPTREYFTAACAAVGKLPARCLFVDDDDRHVRGARVVGLAAYRWSGGTDDLPYLRAALVADLHA